MSAIYFGDLNPLKGLRAICALFIMVGHFFNYFAPNFQKTQGNKKIDHNKDYPGYVFPIEYLQAVSFFLILSGISLSRLYSHTGALDTKTGKKKFMWKRFARLSPAYYLGLLLGFLPFFYNTYMNQKKYLDFFGSLIAAPFFLQTVFPLFLAWDGPLWTVSIFMMSYVVYVWFNKKCRVWSQRKLYTYATIFYLLPAFFIVLFIALKFYAFNILVHVWLDRILHFLIGAILGELTERYRKKHGLKNEESYNERKDATKWIIVADLGTLVLIGTQVIVILYGQTFLPYFFEFVCVPFHCIWIFALLQSKKSLTCRILNLPFFDILNESSYTVYCIHFPLFFLYTYIVNKKLVKCYDFWGCTTFALDYWHVFIAVPIIWIISILYLKLVELPLKKIMVRKINKKYAQNKDTQDLTEILLNEEKLDTSESNSSRSEQSKSSDEN
ncbi:o-acyltransferase [Anaeramoeba flamelloides]|uniref:O-acyltransferase n=1 Tax=Anaeramoeba flamelloides TaxID=1746091 RepID=A0ABQ8XD36_9EUKA|nr:o-acyltransferase [Anaeramoeba flamelloides]